MARVTFVTPNGQSVEIEAVDGASLMESAIRNSVDGIVAECGGACACATCHVHVSDAWTAIVGGPSPMESDMLEFAENVTPNSRLSCQIKVGPPFDGLEVTVAEGNG